MIKIILSFFILWTLVAAAYAAFNGLQGNQKLSFLKLVFKSGIAALVAAASLTLLVILF